MASHGDATPGGRTARNEDKDEEKAESCPNTFEGWIRSVDRLLEANPAFISALRSAFIRFQNPKTSTIPPESLLPALHLLFQRASEELDPRAKKLFLRPVTREDLDILAQENDDLDIDKPTDIETFGIIAKKLLKHILVHRGKRLGFFVVGGVVAVHVVKGVVRKLPFLGPAAGIFLGLLPSIIVGPVVGITAALYT